MNWERHHIEVVRAAAAGNHSRAADLLREHLASLGCDPLALRIVTELRRRGGTGTGSTISGASFPVAPCLDVTSRMTIRPARSIATDLSLPPTATGEAAVHEGDHEIPSCRGDRTRWGGGEREATIQV